MPPSATEAERPEAESPEVDVPATAPRRRIGRIVLGIVVVGMMAMWVYVLYLAFGPGRQPPIDRLDDPAFARAAENRCAEAVAEVEALPFASEQPGAAERAAVLDDANVIFSDMLDDLDELVLLAPGGDQRDHSQDWLADWRVLLANRVDYAERLRTDPEARLLISEKDDTGRHITGWIDEFAKANRMPSCITPADV